MAANKIRKKTIAGSASQTVKKRKKTSSAHYILIIMIMASVIAVLAVNMLDKRNTAFSGNSVLEKDFSESEKRNNPDGADQEKNSENKENQVPEKTGNANQENRRVKVFFASVNEINGKISYSSFERIVPDKDIYREVIKTLASGISKDEEQKGFLSAVPSGMKVNSAIIKNGIINLDTTPDIYKDAYGDIAVTRINQIFLTLVQFKEVSGLVITVNGKKTNTISQDGRIIHWPMKKKL